MNSYAETNRFNAENYDRICLILPKGSKKRIRLAALQAEKSMNEYILEMLPKQLVGTFKREAKASGDG